MTLKTGVMMLNIQLCITGINCILNIEIEISYLKIAIGLIFHNSTICTVFLQPW